ncbi:MAG: hypothetical protein PHH54_00510 [Candidatus Nanoarchaeia archaeon]|nr:hypothetical protein [Candidatus Nanoarchaeia archaeon]MDD5740444.1 hypothetical protein [Candidatus Nanoarchaeia archaeon]
MEEKIKMISAATRVIKFRKQNPLAIDEEVFQDVSDYISEMDDIRDEKVKRCMVAAAAKAFKISREDPKLTEKEVLRKVMDEIPGMVLEIEQEEKSK